MARDFFQIVNYATSIPSWARIVVCTMLLAHLLWAPRSYGKHFTTGGPRLTQIAILTSCRTECCYFASHRFVSKSRPERFFHYGLQEVNQVWTFETYTKINFQLQKYQNRSFNQILCLSLHSWTCRIVSVSENVLIAAAYIHQVTCWPNWHASNSSHSLWIFSGSHKSIRYPTVSSTSGYCRVQIHDSMDHFVVSDQKTLVLLAKRDIDNNACLGFNPGVTVGTHRLLAAISTSIPPVTRKGAHWICPEWFVWDSTAGSLDSVS